MFPVLIIGITAGDSYPACRRFGGRDRRSAKRVDGVAAAVVHGGLERQVRARSSRVGSRHWTFRFAQLVPILASQNSLSVPGRQHPQRHMDFLVRTPESLQSGGGGEVVIAAPGGIPVKLKDIAEVRDFFKERAYDVRLNGKRAMAIFVRSRAAQHPSEVSRRPRQIGGRQAHLPADVQMGVVTDIPMSCFDGNLRDNVFWADPRRLLRDSVLRGQLRASLIVATSVPTSLIITFLLMYAAGYTINTTKSGGSGNRGGRGRGRRDRGSSTISTGTVARARGLAKAPSTARTRWAWL